MLRFKIEELRAKLSKKIAENDSLTCEEVVKSSEELDKLIELYYSIIITDEKTCAI